MTPIILAIVVPTLLLGTVAAVSAPRLAGRDQVRLGRPGTRSNLVSKLRNIVHGRSARARALAVLVAWAATLIVIGWISGVLTGLGPQAVALPGDQPVLSWFLNRRVAWLTDVMLAVTWFGDSIVLVTLAAAVGTWWRWRTGSWRALVITLASYAGAALTFNAIKVLTGRPRPAATISLLTPSGSAYPSGHAVDVTAVYLGITIVAVWSGERRIAAWTAGLGAAGIVLVAVSRLYLGVHWLSDVIIGSAIGAAWTTGLVVTLSALWSRRTAAGPGRDATRRGVERNLDRPAANHSDGTPGA